jgi:hypothetical protein
MTKYFTIQEAKLALMRTNLPHSVREKILSELRRRGGDLISPIELQNITRRMMYEAKDGVDTQQAWKVRRGLKKEF